MDVNFMKYHQPNNPSAEFKGKSKLGIYYDALMEVDHYVGRILDTLDELGIADDTIVLFSADNGPWIDAAPDAGYTPFRGAKALPTRVGSACPRSFGRRGGSRRAPSRTR